MKEREKRMTKIVDHRNIRYSECSVRFADKLHVLETRIRVVKFREIVSLTSQMRSASHAESIRRDLTRFRETLFEDKNDPREFNYVEHAEEKRGNRAISSYE